MEATEILSAYELLKVHGFKILPADGRVGEGVSHNVNIKGIMHLNEDTRGEVGSLDNPPSVSIKRDLGFPNRERSREHDDVREVGQSRPLTPNILQGNTSSQSNFISMLHSQGHASNNEPPAITTNRTLDIGEQAGSHATNRPTNRERSRECLHANVDTEVRQLGQAIRNSEDPFLQGNGAVQSTNHNGHPAITINRRSEIGTNPQQTFTQAV